MVKKICLSCRFNTSLRANATKFGKVFNNKGEKMALWTIKSGFVNHTPPIGFTRLKQKDIFNQKTGNYYTIVLGKRYANRYIYVWAAVPTKNSLKIERAAKSYNLKKPNDVFGKLDKNGRLRIKIRNPQIYKESDIFPPHLHFKVANKDGTTYTNDFFTETYLGIINYEELNKKMNGTYVIIDALPSEYYAKYKIPNSVNLCYKKCKTMTEKELNNFMKDILINYPKIEKMVKSKKLSIKNIPIIVYCAKSSCSAGEELANCLLKKDYINILDYKPGLKDYYKRKFNKSLF